MTRSVQAIYENGVLRPLEPLTLNDHEQVTVTLSEPVGHWLDAAFLRYLETQADDDVTLEQVRAGLAKIPGSMVRDFQSERAERT